MSGLKNMVKIDPKDNPTIKKNAQILFFFKTLERKLEKVVRPIKKPTIRHR